MTRSRLGIIGNPLGHSLSPVLHAAVIGKLGLAYTYEKWELAEAELPAFMEEARRPASGILGFNVTIPYKEKVIPFLDRLDPACARLGAVNTVKVEEGLLVGYNTDGLGFLESLERHGADFRSRPVLLLGAGGAAKGIALTLAEEGAGTLDLAVRDPGKGEELARRIREAGAGSAVLSWTDLPKLDLHPYGLIVQTTPLGMKNVGGAPDLLYGSLRGDQVAADIVYNPLDTEFLKRCRVAGARTIGGLEMLVYQGYHSFRIWTGLEGDPELMLRTGREILEGRHE